ncbi:MAG: cysteine--tRNA ligase [Patescibacteria group bacterium]
MKILNTLSGQKEEFEPIQDKKVGMFVCGPTVYDWSHIGHARTYVIFDIISKYLRSKGHKVKFIMNITDIDDKIIERARNEGKSWKEIADFFEKEFMADMNALYIKVDKFAKATDHIKEIIKQISALVKKSYAYEIEGEGVYFDISKFEDYGKLSKRTVEQAEDAVSRIDESVSKRNKGDFVLWKFSTAIPQPAYGGAEPSTSTADEPSWDSPWGKGRPGWHIEDTAISEKYLGKQYEIHCGGRDLAFPHHEAEIAQQEAASGKNPFVKYWLHSGFVTVDGQKMSKSLGNFITIREVLQEYPPEALRFMIASSHYRSPVAYSEDLIKSSEAAIQRIIELKDKLDLLKKSSNAEDLDIGVENLIKTAREKFEEKMDDDFNTPEAVAVIFDFIRMVNGLIDENKISKKSADKILKFIEELDKVLGVIPEKKSIPAEISKLVQTREKLRKNKEWLEADKIRDRIQEGGYSIEDTLYGPLVKKSLEHRI